MEDDGWPPVSVRMEEKPKLILNQLAEEGYFDSFSDAIRSSIDYLENAEAMVNNPETQQRIRELGNVYDGISEPRYSPKVVDFFFDLHYLLDGFHDIAEKKGFMELEDRIEDYRREFFEEEDLLDYRNTSKEKRKEFVYQTGELVLDLLETQNYLESLGQETYGEELEDFVEHHFEESHLPAEEVEGDQPYIKLKL